MASAIGDGHRGRAELPRRRLRVDALAGVLAAAVILVIGFAVMLAGSGVWTAQTTAIVLPAKNLDVNTAASYYDNLSTGQISSTVADILGLAKYKDEAAARIGLSAHQAAGVKIVAKASTGTSLITVTATAPTRAVAAEMADGVVQSGRSDVDTLASPYVLSVVSTTGGHATESNGLDTTKFAVILLVVAIAVAIGVQQGLVALRRASRGPVGATVPSTTAEAEIERAVAWPPDHAPEQEVPRLVDEPFDGDRGRRSPDRTLAWEDWHRPS